MRTKLSLAPDLTARRWDAARATRILAAWQRSGESLAAFARAHGLNAQRLSWWRRRLDEVEEHDRRPPPVAPLAFIPAAVTAPAPGRIVVRLPRGVEVEAADAAAAPAEWLAMLAHALVEKP